MTDHPNITKLAQSLPASVPFVGPEAQERQNGTAFAARLGANESTFGPSPKAIIAMQNAAPEAWKYADPENHDLRQALATYHGIDPQHIAIDAGIDTLLGLLVRLVITEGDHVVTSAGAYPTFNYHVTGFGGTLHQMPYAGDFEDPERLCAKAHEVNAKLIYLANPDNPMGTWHDASNIRRMISALPEGCLLVLDEAYIEFAPKGTAPDWTPEDPRVIRMRTFSKAYGLAGARIGYAIGATPLIASFDKVRNHFGMSRIAQAGALAALADENWLEHIKDAVTTSRDDIARIAYDNGLTPLASGTNFVTIDCGEGAEFSQKVLQNLIKAGIFVRMPGVEPLNRCIRVSCSGPEDMARFEKALPAALLAARL